MIEVRASGSSLSRPVRFEVRLQRQERSGDIAASIITFQDPKGRICPPISASFFIIKTSPVRWTSNATEIGEIPVVRDGKIDTISVTYSSKSGFSSPALRFLNRSLIAMSSNCSVWVKSSESEQITSFVSRRVKKPPSPWRKLTKNRR